MAAKTLKTLPIHRTAFRFWMDGHSLTAIAKKCGASPTTVAWWCRKEGWEQLATDLAPILREKLLELESRDLVDVAAQHLQEAKKLRLRTLEMLDGYVSKVVIEQDKKGNPKPIVFMRHLRPSDLETVVGVWAKTAEIEQRLLSGQLPGTVVASEHRFPELAELLDKAWEGRASQAPTPIEVAEVSRKALASTTEAPPNGRRRKSK